MKTRIHEDIKFDIGLKPQALDGAGTGKYFPMSDYGLFLVLVLANGVAADETIELKLLQAKDADGLDSKDITDAVITLNANSGVNELTATLVSVAVDETITINGIEFTAANATTPANREFDISGNDAADAAELASVINDPDYGVPGIKATVNSNVVTLEAEEPGEEVVTASVSNTTITLATIEMQGFVETGPYALDRKNDYNHVAVKLTTSASINVAANVLRGNGRITPAQKVGGSKTV